MADMTDEQVRAALSQLVAANTQVELAAVELLTEGLSGPNVAMLLAATDVRGELIAGVSIQTRTLN